MHYTIGISHSTWKRDSIAIASNGTVKIYQSLHRIRDIFLIIYYLFIIILLKVKHICIIQLESVSPK